MTSSFHSVAAVLLMLSTLFSPIFAIEIDIDDPSSVKSAASTVAKGLVALYNGDSGGTLGKWPYPPYYWWESGAAWGALINYWYYTGDDTYNDITRTGLAAQISSTDDFMPTAETFDLGNDDQAFWAIAAMSAAEKGFPAPPSPYPGWLKIVENVFNDWVDRWEPGSCNGGLKWQIFSQNNGYDYKNSISNGGFFQIAARLAAATGNQTYVDWAEKVWDWTTSVGLIDSSYSVYDGTDDTKNCTSIDHLQWTYNVGMWMYGAAVLQNYTNGADIWVERTKGLLNSADLFISPFSNATNVLYEIECEKSGNCDTDQLSMKGYLARWLAGTSAVAPFTAGQVGTILRASASAAATACSGKGDSTCGFKWYVGGWDGTSGMGQQLCALEAMTAVLINSTSNATVSSSSTSTSSSSSASVTAMTSSVSTATTTSDVINDHTSSSSLSPASNITSTSSIVANASTSSTTVVATTNSTSSVPTSILTFSTTSDVPTSTSTITAAAESASHSSSQTATPEPYTGSAAAMPGASSILQSIIFAIALLFINL